MAMSKTWTIALILLGVVVVALFIITGAAP